MLVKHVLQPEGQMGILWINVEDTTLPHAHCRHGLEMSLPTLKGVMGWASRVSLDRRKSEAVGWRRGIILNLDGTLLDARGGLKARGFQQVSGSVPNGRCFMGHLLGHKSGCLKGLSIFKWIFSAWPGYRLHLCERLKIVPSIDGIYRVSVRGYIEIRIPDLVSYLHFLLSIIEPEPRREYQSLLWWTRPNFTVQLWYIDGTHYFEGLNRSLIDRLVSSANGFRPFNHVPWCLGFIMYFHLGS